mgnify:FL=1
MEAGPEDLNRERKDFDMVSRSLLAVLALTAGAAALATPTVLSAFDRGGMRGGMMDGGIGGAPWADFDFAGADKDSDGKITRDELTAYRQSNLAGIDSDGDKMISAAELAAKMTVRMQARIEAMAKERVEAQDVDGDGKLSVEELIAPPMAGRLFDRADADGDGAVTEAELQAMRDRMGGMMGRGGNGQRGQEMRGHGMRDHGMQGQGMQGQGMGQGGWFGDDDRGYGMGQGYGMGPCRTQGGTTNDGAGQ